MTAAAPTFLVSDIADHLVEFYDTEDFLVGTVAGFAGPALNAGDSVIVVATAPHRLAFDAALRASKVDVDAALASGRFLTFDASERLSTFMVDGAPDGKRFAEMIGPVLKRAGAGGRRVRIYGEMVALLWDAGDIASAIALEDLWNDLAAEAAFLLLCAYPMRAFADSDHATDFARICDRHSSVIPTEEHAALGGADGQQRVVARLQQGMTALQADIAGLKARHEDAGIAYAASLCAADVAPRVVTAPSAPTVSTGPSHLAGSPGGKLLVETLGTLSNRIRYADSA